MIPRPSAAFVLGHPAHFLAFGFGAGLSPVAPGTAGTLLAFPLWWMLGPVGSPLALLALVGALFGIGVWACDITGRHLGVPDHGGMCWDEVVAMLLILAMIPNSAAWQASAFLLFRVFDVVKPAPIRQLEMNMKGGFGVMFDDILAAAYTLLALAIIKRLLF